MARTNYTRRQIKDQFIGKKTSRDSWGTVDRVMFDTMHDGRKVAILAYGETGDYTVDGIVDMDTAENLIPTHCRPAHSIEDIYDVAGEMYCEYVNEYDPFAR